METNNALQTAYEEIVADLKAGAVYSDNDIRATARRYEVEATDLYTLIVAFRGN